MGSTDGPVILDTEKIKRATISVDAETAAYCGMPVASCLCTQEERELLTRLYAESEAMRTQGASNFDGDFVNWQEIISIFRADPNSSGSYSESPTELIHEVINQRDDLLLRLAALEKAVATARKIPKSLGEELRALNHNYSSSRLQELYEALSACPPVKG